MVRTKIWLVLVLILILSACQKEIEYQVSNHTLGLEGAESVQAIIEMRSGDIAVHGGADQNLLEAELSYNMENEPPEVTYGVEGGPGDLSIQGSSSVFGFSVAGKDNLWDLAFNENTPLDLELSVSDADTELDLSELSLTKLTTENNSGNVAVDLSGEHPSLASVNIKRANSGSVILDLTGKYDSLSTIDAELNGANLKLDLTGEWARDLDITMVGGSGNDVTLVFPQDVGVTVNFDSDTNEVTAEGFSVAGTTYSNQASDSADIEFNFNIEFDRGEVTLVTAQQ